MLAAAKMRPTMRLVLTAVTVPTCSNTPELVVLSVPVLFIVDLSVRTMRWPLWVALAVLVASAVHNCALLTRAIRREVAVEATVSMATPTMLTVVDDDVEGVTVAAVLLRSTISPIVYACEAMV